MAIPLERGSEGRHETSVARLPGWVPVTGRWLGGATLPGKTNWARRVRLATSGRRRWNFVICISRLRFGAEESWLFRGTSRGVRGHPKAAGSGGRLRKSCHFTAATRNPIPIETRSALPSRAYDLILRG